MSIENTDTTASNVFDLDEDMLSGQSVQDTEQASPESEETNTKEEVAETTDDDTVATETDDTDEEEVEDTPPPKKRNKTQERIVGLNTELQETRRELQAVKEQLAKQNEPPAPVQKNDAPHFEDVNEDGSEKYPLGQYDPKYLADLVSHTLAEERKAAEAKITEEQKAREIEAQRNELTSNWNTKLGPAQERYPDFLEKGNDLVELFQDLPQEYGNFLTETLMRMEYGPDVLYYLANNTDEAARIVQMGGQMAPIALGRIEAKFAAAEEIKKNAKPKVSAAPPPPPSNKGVEVAKSFDFETGNLDDFEKLFHDKRRKNL